MNISGVWSDWPIPICDRGRSIVTAILPCLLALLHNSTYSALYWTTPCIALRDAQHWDCTAELFNVHVVHAVHSTVQSVLKHCPHYANLNMRNHRKIDPLDSLKRILCNKTLLHRTVLCNKAMHPKKTQTLLKGKFPIIQFNTFNRWDERVITMEVDEMLRINRIWEPEIFWGEWHNRSSAMNSKQHHHIVTNTCCALLHCRFSPLHIYCGLGKTPAEKKVFIARKGGRGGVDLLALFSPCNCL